MVHSEKLMIRCKMRELTIALSLTENKKSLRTYSSTVVAKLLESSPTGFLQCFDTAGLVIWPVKIVPEMPYYVSSRTLNRTHSPPKYVWKGSLQGDARRRMGLGLGG